MKDIHYVPIGDAYTACGKPRSNIAPAGITLIPEHTTCPVCDEKIDDAIYAGEADEMTRLYLEGRV